MISSVSIFFLIFFCVIKNVYSKGTPGDILGTFACDCYGMNFNDCGTPEVPVESLPKNCSSYIYQNFLVNNHTMVDEGKLFGGIKGYLDQLIKTNITVLVYYYHGSQMEWCMAVKSGTAGLTTEMNNLKSLLDTHPGVKGLILRGLLDVDTEVTSTQCSNYTQNIKAYIDLLHKTFTELSIGISIISTVARDWYNNSNLAWLDYRVLDRSVDFYVVTFEDLNTCSDEFTKTGRYPLSGNNSNTVDAIKTFLDNAGVQSNKVHYTFYNFGFAKDEYNHCDAYPINSCKNAPDAKTSICMDTLQTLYEKGAFAKKNGVGFVVTAIDADDYDSSCKCGQSFPAFHALLNGFKGGPPPAPCALYDRT